MQISANDSVSWFSNFWFELNFKNRSELNFSEMKIHKLVVDVPDMNHRHSALFDSILFPHAAVSASLS